MNNRSTRQPASELTLEVTAYGLHNCGGTQEFGLQSRSGELDDGTPTDDGGLRYECRARTRPKPDGSVSCTGEYLHGPANERFLYISFRRPGDDTWKRRTKILLPSSIGPDVRRLSARVIDKGTSRVQFQGDWTAETEDTGKR